MLRMFLVSDHLHGRGHDAFFCSDSDVGCANVRSSAWQAPELFRAMTLFGDIC